MASLNKVDNTLRVQGMAARAAVVLMLMEVAVVARPVKCALSTGYTYIAVSGALEGLAPEYDETSATYYARLLSSAATYVAVTESTDSCSLPVNSIVYIYNSESGKALTWREEGTDEYILIEQEVSSVTSDGASFRFLQATDVLLPCPRILSAQCQAYYLVSNPDGTSSSSSTSTGGGLQAYEEDSVTYIKAAAVGSTGDLPLVIRSSSITASAMLFP